MTKHHRNDRERLFRVAAEDNGERYHIVAPRTTRCGQPLTVTVDFTRATDASVLAVLIDHSQDEHVRELLTQALHLLTAPS